MSKFRKIAIGAPMAGLIAVTMMAAPASAQSRHYDRDRDNGKDKSAENALIGAVIGGLAGAIFGNGDGTYIAGGALAGAAVGAASGSSNNDCNYSRGGRCYNSQGHWERERGGYDYRYERGPDRRGDRYSSPPRRDERRDYRHERRW